MEPVKRNRAASLNFYCYNEIVTITEKKESASDELKSFGNKDTFSILFLIRYPAGILKRLFVRIYCDFSLLRNLRPRSNSINLEIIQPLLYKNSQSHSCFTNSYIAVKQERSCISLHFTPCSKNERYAACDFSRRYISHSSYPVLLFLGALNFYIILPFVT